ncbi:putative entry exclusion protein TrbK-alt [Chelativorans sp. AA-79]|uniref:putative entry exclusion protein TrbK-alt n=1 Tax=Chelativorans sp. AA-79 TaxID=3028735 RepID=UPI0023F87AB9|nr:putative entry exclusion protein TrbK-alt [Chelativorans sp. AA-79]WEX08531.1 putative entry exclusion protein TrbK-alt [Chelativorans sp. AA-79]
MDLKIAARMIAVLAIGSAMIAAVMVLRRDGAEDAPALRLRHPGGEPARSELLRCRDLGMAAADDPACLKAWAKNRRRFFQRDEPQRPAEPKPERFGAIPPPAESTFPELLPIAPDDAPRPGMGEVTGNTAGDEKPEISVEPRP